MLSPTDIVKKMFDSDQMSQWLGIKILTVNKGQVVLKLTVKRIMTNGFGIAHGGITYSLSDSALAFSVNTYGNHSVSIETSISHLKPVKIGDTLTTSIEEISLTKRIGIYHIKVFNQNNNLVSTMKGTMYRTDKTWE